MEKITFKMYLESRDQLLKAIDNTPVSLVEYDVKKYCTISVGESSDEALLVSLKPSHKVIVEWQHINPVDPTPISIKFKGVSGLDNSYSVYWTGNKLHKWLNRHTINEHNIIGK